MRRIDGSFPGLASLATYHCNQIFHNFIINRIRERGYIDAQDSDGKGTILGLDDESLEELNEYYSHFMRGVYRIANKSKRQDHFVLLESSLIGWELNREH